MRWMQIIYISTQKSTFLYITFMFYWICRLVPECANDGAAGGKKGALKETNIALRGDSARTTERVRHSSQFEYPAAATLTKEEICSCLEDTGIFPSLSEVSPEDALFVTEALIEAGIPIVKISMNDPDATEVIAYLAKHAPTAIVGAGSIRNMNTAQMCLDAGARFLATDGLIPGIIEFATKEKLVSVQGGLTLTEVISAWDGGADFVKVIPCSAVGGHNYIRTLKTVIPQARLIAAGGVNQLTALNYIMAGAAALGVGQELIPTEAVQLRQARRIQELSRRFLAAVDNGRA
jgi:2-dehydro-3-deoxyphosphogluconate aldolase / (4S)-4-hydroxy-2-oxoglutarate aldolase